MRSGMHDCYLRVLQNVLRVMQNMYFTMPSASARLSRQTATAKSKASCPPTQKSKCTWPVQQCVHSTARLAQSLLHPWTQTLSSIMLHVCDVALWLPSDKFTVVGTVWSKTAHCVVWVVLCCTQMRKSFSFVSRGFPCSNLSRPSQDTDHSVCRPGSTPLPCLSAKRAFLVDKRNYWPRTNKVKMTK